MSEEKTTEKVDKKSRDKPRTYSKISKIERFTAFFKRMLYHCLYGYLAVRKLMSIVKEIFTKKGD